MVGLLCELANEDGTAEISWSDACSLGGGDLLQPNIGINPPKVRLSLCKNCTFGGVIL
jgi:hypothetical protein